MQVLLFFFGCLLVYCIVLLFLLHLLFLPGDAVLLGNLSAHASVLDGQSVVSDAAVGLPFVELGLENVSESPVGRFDDGLAAGELHAGTAQGFQYGDATGLSGSDGDQDGSNANTGSGTVWLTIGTSHSGLQSISTGAGQHLVNSDDVVRMDSHAQVEHVLTTVLDHVLVGLDTCCFQGFAADLLTLLGDNMRTVREAIDGSKSVPGIVNADLWIGNTTAEP